MDGWVFHGGRMDGWFLVGAFVAHSSKRSGGDGDLEQNLYCASQSHPHLYVLSLARVKALRSGQSCVRRHACKGCCCCCCCCWCCCC